MLAECVFFWRELCYFRPFSATRTDRGVAMAVPRRCYGETSCFRFPFSRDACAGLPFLLDPPTSAPVTSFIRADNMAAAAVRTRRFKWALELGTAPGGR